MMNKKFSWKLLAGLLIAVACEKNSTEPDRDTTNHFEVKVIGEGLDCGNTYLIEFQDKLEEMYQIVGSEYWNTCYADSLPEEFKQENLVIFVKIRKPNQDEIYPCTRLGPTYPHVIVSNVIRK